MKKDGYPIAVLGIAIGLYALFSVVGRVQVSEGPAVSIAWVEDASE